MNCWGCRFHQAGDASLFGMCLYFARLGRPPREIPSTVVDVGCKFFKAKEESNVKSNDNARG